MGRNKYSLAIYEKALPPGLPFRTMLETALESGFDRLEISIDESDVRLNRLDWSAQQKRELWQISKDCGVPITTMCLSGHRKYPFGSHDETKRQRSMEIMEKAVDFSCEVGIRIIQLAGYDVYYESHDAFTEEKFAENLQKSVDYASKCGIVLAFETMESPFMDTVEKAMKYVNMINSAWLGIYPDIGNLQNAAVLYGHEVEDDLKLGAGHIFAVHLKETLPGIYRDMRFNSGGHTKYDSCIQTVSENGVSMFTGEFWYKDGQDCHQEAMSAAAFLRSKLNAVFL